MKVLGIGLDATTVNFLRENGIAIEPQSVETAEDLQDFLHADHYDAAVLDLERSGLGIYAPRGVRAKKIATPVIGISFGGPDRVWGDHRAMFLENGGDDLLRGPVNPRELVATLRAVTRRFKGALLDVYEYTHRGATLRVNLTTKSVTVNERPVHLTGKECAIMLLFASSPGRVLSKEMLLTQIYVEGVDDEPEMKIIDVFVCKVRRKLTEMHPDADQFIQTEWGRGYRFPEPSPQSAVGKAA